MTRLVKIDGLPIKDAKKSLTIVITPDDVRQGAKKNANTCAAAVSLCRNHQAAKVHVSRVYIKDGKKWVRYVTPPALRSEIIAFDRGGSFEPGIYTLHKVDAHNKTGERAKRANYADRSPKTGKKRKRHVTTGIRPHFG